MRAIRSACSCWLFARLARTSSITSRGGLSPLLSCPSGPSLPVSVDCWLGSLLCPASVCHDSTCLRSLATKGLSIVLAKSSCYGLSQKSVTFGESWFYITSLLSASRGLAARSLELCRLCTRHTAGKSGSILGTVCVCVGHDLRACRARYYRVCYTIYHKHNAQQPLSGISNVARCVGVGQEKRARSCEVGVCAVRGARRAAWLGGARA